MNIEMLLSELLPEPPTRICEVCGSVEQLVPPTLLWFSCPQCFPADFSRIDTTRTNTDEH